VLCFRAQFVNQLNVAVFFSENKNVEKQNQVHLSQELPNSSIITKGGTRDYLTWDGVAGL
jgi:hypothetical protein